MPAVREDDLVRSEAGVRAWDTCMTLVATAQKLGVNVIAYLHDRISGTGNRDVQGGPRVLVA